jgi:hypothetical protein
MKAAAPTIVGVGIDTIKLNIHLVDARGEPVMLEAVSGDMETILQSWQERARAQKKPVGTTMTFHEARMVMYPNGAPAWKYILRNDCLELKLLPRLHVPMVGSATLQSPYLWSIGKPDEAVEEVEGFLYDLFGAALRLQIGQLDPCIDLVGLRLPSDWERVFLTSAKLKPAIGPSRKDEYYYRGRELETIRFSGHGRPISCRLYNKTLEIKQQSPDKVWFHDVWKQRGWDGKAVVWRVEFSIEREGFNQMNLHDPYAALRNVRRIWAYCTEDWLRMVAPGRGKNRARWKIDPTWLLIQRAFDDYGDAPPDGLGAITRERRRQKNFERGIAAIAGYGTTVAAWRDKEWNEETFLDDMLAMLRTEIQARWEKLNVSPLDIVKEKQFLYSRKA